MERDTDKKTEYFKVVIIGDGSTALANSLTSKGDTSTKSTFKTTIGVDFKLGEMQLKDGTLARVQYWDSVAQARFESISKTHYVNSAAVVFCFNPDVDGSVEKAMSRYDSYKKLFPDDGNEKIFLVSTSDNPAANLKNIDDFAKSKSITCLNKQEAISDGRLTKGLGEIFEAEHAKTISQPISKPPKESTFDLSKITKDSLNQAFKKAVNSYKEERWTPWTAKQAESKVTERIPKDITDENCLVKLATFMSSGHGDDQGSFRCKVAEAVLGEKVTNDQEAKELIHILQKALVAIPGMEKKISEQAEVKESIAPKSFGGHDEL